MTAVDFTPQWYHRSRQVRRDRRRRSVYVGVLMGVMCVWWAINRGMIASAHAALYQANEGQRQVLVMRGDLGKLQSRWATLREQLRRFRSMADYMEPTVIFAEISHLLPDAARLDSFELKHIDVNAGRQAAQRGMTTSTPEQARHSEFMVRVVAQARENGTLLQFCLNLQNSPLFEFTDFHNITSQRIVGGTIEQRQIDLYVLRAEHIE